MIISVSRRTDIPAFYSEWFLNRIKEGFVLVRNPMNPHQIRRISLRPSDVECIVFWTKNPAPLLPHLDALKDYSFYFQYTLTPYGADIEPHTPPKAELFKTFRNLSEKIGPERVIWRYDPIIFSDSMDSEWHTRRFEEMCQKLHGQSTKCVVSFVDFYRKCVKKLNILNARLARYEEMVELLQILNQIAKEHGIKIETCSEKISLQGVSPSKCIDDCLICKITGRNLIFKKDKIQRLECGCVESLDIGAYNTCSHLCEYCYANAENNLVSRNIKHHNPKSPLLIGELLPTDKITEVKTKQFDAGDTQTLLF